MHTTCTLFISKSWICSCFIREEFEKIFIHILGGFSKSFWYCLLFGSFSFHLSFGSLYVMRHYRYCRQKLSTVSKIQWYSLCLTITLNYPWESFLVPQMFKLKTNVYNSCIRKRDTKLMACLLFYLLTFYLNLCNFTLQVMHVYC